MLSKLKSLKYYFLITTLLVVFAFPIKGSAAEKLWSTQVDIWVPPFNTELKRETATYTPLQKAEKKWRIFAFIPHLKDSYWLSANYGLISEAKRLGINLVIYEAGGYEHLDTQRVQIQKCIASEKPDGIIIGAISDTGLNDLIEIAAKKKIPIVDLANTIRSPHINARVASSFQNMGLQAGEFLVKLQEKLGKPARVAWFPGPKGAGWVESGLKGFSEAIKDKPVSVIATEYGDTGRTSQGALITKVLNTYGDDIDFIVGTAPTAEAAVPMLRERNMLGKVKIISYYFTLGINRGIRRGAIAGAPTDSTVMLSKIAVDTIVRCLEEQDYYKHVAPAVVIVDQKNIKKWDSSGTLPPRGFRPTFSVN
ncbi:TMAO reductase system periplasmic protein TorT [Maridesulfovibrio frigidus]|uniref:TMAO reductase system periplasmic protein TorT n=1 Tax=Maridesulfovibrio frigidus TaxID=340956 RepID=UPI0004E19510|nr:TMAO reductase system periplasmic protein TorT [Maridesulfovibrio frigidus]